jgi:DNA-binding transcriptional regulator YiaG
MEAREIRAIRREVRMTQTQFAAVLGYSSRTQISVFETGLGTPSKQGVLLLRAVAEGYRPEGWPEAGV